ncbi:MAG: hypothetical protein AB8G14_12740 [Ilumatobacter sp.]
MTIIKVHPAEVVTYGTNATARFGEIVDQLQALTTMVDEVQFEGESAFQFRTETNVLVKDFNTQIQSAMAAMVTNVQTAVGNIQSSMQGARVSLEIPPPTPVTESDARNTENSEMDTDALSGLNVEAPFQAITDAFLSHKTALENVTWLGNAGDAARGAVATLTTQATGVCSTYAADFRKVIDAQVAASIAADTPAAN